MKRTILFIALLMATGSYGQSIERYVLSACGSSSTNSGIQLDQSVGEVAIATFQNQTVFTQGFIQPDDLSHLWLEELNDERVVYPNPAKDYLVVPFESAVVCDLYGKEMKLTWLSTGVLDLSSFESGVYILQHEDFSVRVIKE